MEAKPVVPAMESPKHLFAWFKAKGYQNEVIPKARGEDFLPNAISAAPKLIFLETNSLPLLGDS